MASTYLSRVHGSSTNSKQWTVSVWVKRAKLGYDCSIWGTGNSSGYYTTFLMFTSSDHLRFGNLGGSSMEGELITNRVFRDTNSWYHIVVGVDTDQATASNRVKIYVNGVQETSFSTNNQPSQGQGLRWNEATSTSGPSIGRTGTWDARYFEGCMSHIHLIDGTQYAASDFGETDSTTGEWKIKTSLNVTYGTNGAFVLKDGNSGTDQSSNTNNWTVNGTLTKTEDCPSNVFNTFNYNDNYYENGGFSNGNTTFQTTNSNYSRNTSNLGMTSGKFYWEIKPSATNSQSDYFPHIGITASQITHNQDFLGKASTDYAYSTNSDGTGYKKWNNNTGTAYGSNFAINDIVGVALDLDNNKIYFSKNGTWQNSGDPTSGSTGTGAAYTITAAALTPLGAYFPSVSNYDGTGNVTFQANFGNGYFGTTAVSSAGTNASNNGIFEYDVPNGYTALSTKGLNL